MLSTETVSVKFRQRVFLFKIFGVFLFCIPHQSRAFGFVSRCGFALPVSISGRRKCFGLKNILWKRFRNESWFVLKPEQKAFNISVPLGRFVGPSVSVSLP